MSGLVST